MPGSFLGQRSTTRSRLQRTSIPTSPSRNGNRTMVHDQEERYDCLDALLSPSTSRSNDASHPYNATSSSSSQPYLDEPFRPQASLARPHHAQETRQEDDMPLFTSIAAMLQSTTLSSPDVCFCGAPAEEDSIYCSVACGRQDAMQALCGGSPSRDSFASSSTTSSSRNSASSLASSQASHYRRVAVEEAKRLKEREERTEKKRLPPSGQHWRINTSSLSSTTPSLPSPALSSHSIATSTSSVPSLSASSISSYTTCNSSLNSPTRESYYFPSTPNGPRCQLRPATPTSPSSIIKDGYFSSYLDSTPIAQGQRYEEDEVANGRATFVPHYGQGTNEDYYSMMAMGESRDQVSGLYASSGNQFKQRVKGKMPAKGHTKGKLSFDDVIGIMNGA